MAKKQQRNNPPATPLPPKGGIGSRSLETYKDFRYFDERNRQFWRARYLNETGRQNARGWQFSDYSRAYEKSRSERLRTFYERNPLEFADKVKYADRKDPTAPPEQTFSYDEYEVYNAAFQTKEDLRHLREYSEKKGKIFVVIGDVKGQQLIGELSVMDTIKNQADAWRMRMASAKAKKQDSPDMEELNGEYTITETKNFVTIDYNWL